LELKHTTRSYKIYVVVCSLISVTDDDDKWYHYGLIGGASLALIVAMAAVCCWLYTRQELENVKREQSSANKKAPNARTNDGYSNDAYSNVDESVGYKNKEITTISSNNSESGSNSPFNKRSRRVTPAQGRLAKAWGRQTYDVNKDW